MKNYKQFINEYFTWNDDVTVKTIDLGVLYEEQDGNLDNIVQILQYEFRSLPSDEEYKKIIVCSKSDKRRWELSNNFIDKDFSDGIYFNLNDGKGKIYFQEFEKYVFKIQIFKKRFVLEDPYGEEDWDDIDEAYYPDLTPYEYGFEIPECVNIGWLDKKHEFERGEVPDGFIEKLKKMPTFAQHAGYHNCPFCEGGRGTWSSSIKLAISDEVVYLFPELTKHYISKHNYKPPQEFIDAVLRMEDMSDGDARKYIGNIMLRHKEHFDKIFHRKRRD